jgi:hypothetical protein
MDDLDKEFEDMRGQCELVLRVEGFPIASSAVGDKHHWDFPVKMGDWCYCGKRRWGDE